MEFKFNGQDIVCAILYKIKSLQDKIKGLENDRIENKSKYKEWENLKDKWTKEGNKLEEEYYKIPWFKRLFINKENFIDSRRAEKYPGFRPLCDMEGATIVGLQNKIKILEREKCLFEEGREYVLDLEECKKYGLDIYLCEREG